ncbi:MAG: hypothetical protein RBS01_02790 [Candidatus Dojkabacteria bacterium]|jgi:hypothetical protein|nr:hypothetical protein [Candidatus Dojkabacteria bacterium]
MERIKEFIKKYKVPILIGIILGIVVPLLFLFSKKKAEESSQIENIQSPYFSETEAIDIDLQEISIDSPQKGKVYKVVESENNTIATLLNDLYEYSTPMDFTQETYITFGDGAFSYSPENRVFNIRSEDGFPLWFKIEQKEDISMFFEEYFSIEKVEVSESIKTEKGYQYEGNYILKEVNIGSVYLDGLSFILEVNSEGEILLLRGLFLSEDNMQEYQSMPVATLEELVKNPNYPKMVFNTQIEERYYQQNPMLRASSRMDQYFLESISYMYIFNDSMNGYVLPTYKLIGEGRIINSKEEKFWSKSSIFICSVDPSYLLERIVEDEEYIVDPVAADLP